MDSASPVLSVLHPVIHQPCPTIEQVRARTDDQAARVLEAAGALARWRFDLSDRIDALRLSRGARPWPVSVGTDPGDLSPALHPIDLLRALLALEEETLAEVIPSPNGLLRECAEGWRTVVEGTKQVPLPALDFAWARRWILADLRYGTPAVDVSYLLGALGYDTLSLLVPLSRLVDEDMASEREVVRRCVESARRVSSDRVFEPLLPAYFDRHGGIDAMDQALDEHHGVLIVGNEGTGRTALLEAWLRRLELCSQPAALAQSCVWQNPFDEPWIANEADVEETIAKRATLLALTPKGRLVFYDSRDEDPIRAGEARPQRLWDYDPEYGAGALETALLARCADWASQPWKQVYVAIVVTPDERERLVERVPLVAEFPAIEVPPYDSRDHLPMWLCHSMDRPELGLPQALAVMQDLRPADIQLMKPWDVEPVLGSALAQRLWDPAKLASLQPADWLQRAISRIEQGRDPWHREMLGAKGRFVERFIGDNERFAALFQLESLLRRSAIPHDHRESQGEEAAGQITVPPSIETRAPSRVPPVAQDLPCDLHVVYRGDSEGHFGKRVRRARGSSVLEWFQVAWHKASNPQALEAWVAEAFGGAVPGVTAFFEDVLDEGLEPPDTWQELHELLQYHLYVSGGPEAIRQSAHVLRVKTEADDVDVAYFMFDDAYARAHPDRCAFLLHEDWPLPDGGADGSCEPEIRPSPLLPAGEGEGQTYVCMLTSYHNGSLVDLRPRVFPGVRLPDLCDHLRSVVPLAEEKRTRQQYCWYETWPLEMRLLRAMVGPNDCDLKPALEACNRFPLIHVATNVEHTRIGIGPQPRARASFVDAASDARKVRRNIDRTKIVVGDHIAQMSLWTNETYGYQQWFLFDDRWAAAHEDLACSLLRYASGWDPLI